MYKTKILVIEDEVIVAKDIQRTLIKLGYDVPAIANSAQSAFEKINQVDPDLVFCDIKLKGSIDGIDIALRLREEFMIPVVFLTSYVDKATLDRAKITEPYGYIVKPFNEVDLQTTVEMALYKFAQDQKVRDNEQRFANVVRNIDEALFITDTENMITYINPRAESFFDLMVNFVKGQSIDKFIEIKHRDLNADFKISDKTFYFTNAQVVDKKSEATTLVNLTISPIKDEINNLIGTAYIIRLKLDETEPVVEKPAQNNQPEVAIDNLPDDSDNNEPIVFQDSFFVKKGSVLVKVFLENIHWIQAMDNYVVIQTTADQFVVHSTMRNIEAKLPADKFVRVHRSYIIQADKISTIDDNTIIINGKIIPVGKSYKDAFNKRLNFL
jgi:DNA-binding LytR/AlgR family response regulator